MPKPQTLMTGLAFGESPRWHDGRLWFSNWTAQDIIAVDPQGKSEVMARVPYHPAWVGPKEQTHVIVRLR